MKPVSITIEGLNSYREKQTIDFERLASRGIFGIFGRTGSGKSTILDAMTLSLYGSIPRNTKEFVNTSQKEALLSYTFSLGKGENKRIYTVERKFKRTDKDGVTNSHAKLYIIEEDGTVRYIAEKAKEVNSAIISILGIDYKDFTRSVVIPQGQFSEFLKLSGKEQRNMLEKLFDLSRYGYELQDKAKRENSRRLQALNEIKTKLTQHESYSEEDIEEYKGLIRNLKDNIAGLDAKRAESLKNLNIAREQLEIKKEIERLTAEKGDLESKRESIDVLNIRAMRAQRAQDIIPVMERIDGLNADILSEEKNISELENVLTELSSSEKELRVRIEELSRRRDEKLPGLMISLREAKENAHLAEEYEELSVKIKDDEGRLTRLKDSLKLVLERIESADKDIGMKDENIRLMRKELEGIFVDTELRRTKDDAIREELALDLLREKKRGLEEKLSDNEKRIGDRSERVLKDARELESLRDEIKTETEGLTLKLRETSELIDNAENELKDLMSREEELRVKNLSVAIRGKLSEGDKCPVCGGDCKEDIAFRNEEAADIELELISLSTHIEEVKDRHDGLRRKRDSLNISIESLNAKGGVADFKEEALNEANRELEELKTGTDEIKTRINDVDADMEKAISRIADILGEHKDIGATGLSELIEARDKKYNEINKKIEKLSSELSTTQRERESLIEERIGLSSEIEGMGHKIELNKGRLEEIESDIKKIFKDKSPEDTIRSIEAELDGYKAEESRLNKEFEELAADVKEKNGLLAASRAKRETDIKYLESSKDELSTRLAKNEFENAAEVKAAFLDESEVSKITAEVEEYRKRLANTDAQLEGRRVALTIEDISEEKCDELSIGHRKIAEELDSLRIELGEKTTVLSNMEEKFRLVADLKVKELEAQKKYDVSMRLMSLLKGNKLVEYVAKNQLEQIVIEASQRLGRITGEKYALEVDDSLQFMIRDNINGGTLRGISSLSGGELFVASLALAISLSSHIQLKGNAPLEFFFLDEGFGSLDSELLDVVTESLEGLRNEDLAIGIITHVEELKSRVPVKLLVETDSTGSSTTRIEKY